MPQEPFQMPPPARKVRLAFVGCGNIASYHVEVEAGSEAGSEAPWLDLAACMERADDSQPLEETADVLELLWTTYKEDRRMAWHCAKAMAHLAAQAICSPGTTSEDGESMDDEWYEDRSEWSDGSRYD